MASTEKSEKTRIEVGFAGGQSMTAHVAPEAAAELEERLVEGKGLFALDADDGRYVVVLARIVYIKRFARDTRLGFGKS